MLIYLIFMAVIGIFHAIWLSTVFPLFFKTQLRGVINTFRVAPAVAFYMLYSVGAVTFAVIPANILGLSMCKTFIYSSLFGLVAYGTYNLMNRTTISSWTLSATLVDMAWGSIVTGISAVVSSYVFNLLFS